jgi:hypothetical protein
MAFSNAELSCLLEGGVVCPSFLDKTVCACSIQSTASWFGDGEKTAPGTCSLKQEAQC